MIKLFTSHKRSSLFCRSVNVEKRKKSFSWNWQKFENKDELRKEFEDLKEQTKKAEDELEEKIKQVRSRIGFRVFWPKDICQKGICTRETYSTKHLWRQLLSKCHNHCFVGQMLLSTLALDQLLWQHCSPLSLSNIGCTSFCQKLFGRKAFGQQTQKSIKQLCWWLLQSHWFVDQIGP